MGNSYSALQQCIEAVGHNRMGFAGFPSSPLTFQLIWVQPYNLDIKVTPAAVVRPRTAEEIAGVVRCAAANNVKVQAKSGGHSFGFVPAQCCCLGLYFLTACVQQLWPRWRGRRRGHRHGQLQAIQHGQQYLACHGRGGLSAGRHVQEAARRGAASHSPRCMPRCWHRRASHNCE